MNKKMIKKISVSHVAIIVGILSSVISVLASYGVRHIVESIKFSPLLKEPITILSLIVFLVTVILVFGNVIRMKSRKEITELESLLEKSDRELLESIRSNTSSLLR